MVPPSVHVIGRGIAGLTIAWELVKRGCSVCIVGPKAAPGTASRAAIGMSSVKGQLLPNTPLFAAKLKGHEKLMGWISTLESESGRILPRDLGNVYEVFRDLTGFDGIRERVFHRFPMGCYRVERLAASTLLERTRNHPWARGAAGAFRYPQDLWFDPVAALDALEDLLQRRGVSFDPRPVRALEMRSEAALSLCFDDGIVPVSKAILAAGYASSTILANSPAFAPLRLDLWPVSGATMKGSWGITEEEAPHASFRFAKFNAVSHGGRFWVGSTAYAGELRENIGSIKWFPGLQAGDGAAALVEYLVDSLRVKWEALTFLEGTRARFRDRMPVVGPLGPGGSAAPLWVALGFYKNGLQLAPLFAEKLVSWLLNPECSTIDPLFTPSRFLPKL